MYMVAHGNPAVYVDIKLTRALGQPMRVSGDIYIAGEADLTVDPTLYHMDGKSCWTESVASWHLNLDMDMSNVKTLTIQANS
jgi:hypothetical protein|tara:strand:- start:237 stop:482 length:246 start_codon:yes stop_codon:yes gene_type:complete